MAMTINRMAIAAVSAAGTLGSVQGLDVTGTAEARAADTTAAAEPTAVPDSAEAAARRAKDAGDSVADIRLIRPGESSSEEAEVRLSDLAADGPVVLIFYRGGWCPFCIQQLAQFEEAASEIDAAGGRVIAIAGETPETVRRTIAARGFDDIELFADPGHQAAREFNVVYASDRFKDRLAESNGNRRGELNLGVTYIVTESDDAAADEALEIRWAFIEHQYRRRASPDQVVQRLELLD